MGYKPGTSDFFKITYRLFVIPFMTSSGNVPEVNKNFYTLLILNVADEGIHFQFIPCSCLPKLVPQVTNCSCWDASEAQLLWATPLSVPRCGDSLAYYYYGGGGGR